MIKIAMDPHAPWNQPSPRGGMSKEEESQRRSSIQAIMKKKKMSDVEKLRAVFHLMNGSRFTEDFSQVVKDHAHA